MHSAVFTGGYGLGVQLQGSAQTPVCSLPPTVQLCPPGCGPSSLRRLLVHVKKWNEAGTCSDGGGPRSLSRHFLSEAFPLSCQSA